MSYTIIVTRQFKKDYKKIKHQKALITVLDTTITRLQRSESLDAGFNVHRLEGNYKDCLECHVKTDWLLIWQVDENENTLTLIRTGSHSDLF